MSKFQKGQSGNPGGRPRTESAEIRRRLAEGAEGVVAAILDAAMNGDMQAAKIVLDRLLPPLRAAAQTVNLPVPSDATPLDYGRAILAAAASGQIDPDVAGKLTTAAGTLASVLKIQELADRLEALEKALKPRIPPKK